MGLLVPRLIQKPYCMDMSLCLSVTVIIEIFVNKMNFNTLKHTIGLFSGLVQSSSNNNSNYYVWRLYCD